ncbi:hypothetical protein K493DRAFT_299379 [Basidiobolus meristosporus CBS 931.73]|uniref:Uncharacterized protein n=1 Tax=Basidiobolus meristosporus CBS 931.73 TaxID=1314790 RepID=A0A1Y1YNB2_9FUNG|nr:hypothetical protein K493DRAFT_299379 [Basidiobolus meristosporus CBS 931.73]|eukprot:ORX99465.1 hypothetical protein K493DRAFT_299379 [Basidiobolus meristosporus CBS 931.73]
MFNIAALTMGLQSYQVSKKAFRHSYTVRFATDQQNFLNFHRVSDRECIMVHEGVRIPSWKCYAELDGITFILSSDLFYHENVVLFWTPEKLCASLSFDNHNYTWSIGEGFLRCHNDNGVTVAILLPTSGLSFSGTTIYLPSHDKPKVTSALTSLLLITGFKVLEKAELQGLTFRKISQHTSGFLMKENKSGVLHINHSCNSSSSSVDSVTNPPIFFL